MFLVGDPARVHTVLVVVMGAAVVGLTMTAVGWAGLRWTRLHYLETTLGLVWGWLAFCLAVGGLGTWLVIGITLIAKVRLGDKPTAYDDVTASAIVALVTAVIANRQQLFEQYGPGWVAQRFIQGTFRRAVGALVVPQDPMAAQALAVRAIEETEFMSPDGAVSGWGFRAGCARLRLIRAYLVRSPQPVLGPWRAPPAPVKHGAIQGDPS